MLLILFFFVLFTYNIYIMTDLGKKKLKYSLWSVVYLALTVAIVVSAVSLFNNFYYESVYVSGNSMDPTLEGKGSEKALGSDYGIIDKNDGAKKNVKRFQIVTTYYPGEVKEKASYKIKRVLFKPGERFKIEDYNLYLYNNKNHSWGEPLELPFERANIGADSSLNHKNYPDTVLQHDEYFLSGDNWGGSHDSFAVGPIKYDLLVGVVVKMQGRCTVVDGKVTEKQKYADRYFLGVNY